MKNFFIILVALSFAHSVHAADMRVVKVLPDTPDIKVGDEVLLELPFASEGIAYNAVEGIVRVPPIFSIEKVLTGSSFISVWLENPSQFTGNAIRFSGITPAGYNKETGSVFSIVLRAVAPGNAAITVQDIGVFKNDGTGTRADIPERELTLRVRNARDGEAPYLISIKDTTPPEAFTISIGDKSLVDGKRVIVWSTRDVASGIASYDVYEGNHVFKHVASPYVLENQRFNEKIKVVAYDHAGNAAEAVLIPPGTICIGVSCFGGIGLGIAALVILAALVLIWRTSKR